MIDTIRSVMYAGEDGENDAGNDGSLMMAEVIELGKQLADRDGIPFDPDHNRLLLMMKKLRELDLDAYRNIERINRY